MSGDLRALIIEALNTAAAGHARTDPEAAAERRGHPWSRHDRHHYAADCALCRGDADALAAAVMAVLNREHPGPATDAPVSDAETSAAHRTWLNAQADKHGGLIDLATPSGDGDCPEDVITGYPDHVIVNGDHSRCPCGGDAP